MRAVQCAVWQVQACAGGSSAVQSSQASVCKSVCINQYSASGQWHHQSSEQNQFVSSMVSWNRVVVCRPWHQQGIISVGNRWDQVSGGGGNRNGNFHHRGINRNRNRWYRAAAWLRRRGAAAARRGECAKAGEALRHAAYIVSALQRAAQQRASSAAQRKSSSARRCAWRGRARRAYSRQCAQRYRWRGARSSGAVRIQNGAGGRQAQAVRVCDSAAARVAEGRRGRRQEIARGRQAAAK